ncbi:MAG TPA: glycoside hydrolase family 15 protein [Thermoplasmata archaeon]|nr:glycoside hydrolase family 15 protein [Thermoplasmata archaeon]
MELRGDREAFGAPGIAPRWTHGNKDGVGTAYSVASKLWFTTWRGIVTEVYYPLVDHPQVRDLEFLVADGKGLFQEEKRHLTSRTVRLNDHALGYEVTSSDPGGRYVLHKELIADPHLPVLLERVRFERMRPDADGLSLYLLCAPHLDGGGAGNSGYVGRVAGRDVLLAEKSGTWLALAASVPFSQSSCGFVGASDGWTDLQSHFALEWEFDRALNGNIALTGALDVSGTSEFTVALAFGRGRQHAVAALLQSLSQPYEVHRRRFLEQWDRPAPATGPVRQRSARLQTLYHSSYSVALAHEDKTFPGAFIASLSIPWGYAKGDDDRGGYHLVWTRDLVQVAMGLLAAGDRTTPLRTLTYLAASQQADGGFPQNFWLDGAAYWSGRQLDEVALPILLADRLRRDDALEEFDPYPMVLRAVRYLVLQGPATGQERWEEASGYSPSTLASVIAACVAAAEFARSRNEPGIGEFLLVYADFLEGHLERWTVTRTGTLVPGEPVHYIRIRPVRTDDPTPEEDPDSGTLELANQPPGISRSYPAREIVDAGFLELVRYGVRSPDDPIVASSVRVVDQVLRVDTPLGPCWRRYNHDGYGQRDDGGPFVDWGTGRAWPLLTGERGHYELAAGRDPAPYLATLARFATETGMLPEQVWDGPDLPLLHLLRGGPTGSAMPLVWAHAEYLKLLRSAEDGGVFDRVPAVAERYGRRSSARTGWEVWKPGRRPSRFSAGDHVRILAPEPFRLHWTSDGWTKATDTPSTATPLDLEFVDLPTPSPPGTVFEFTFYWSGRGVWEGRNYTMTSV